MNAYIEQLRADLLAKSDNPAALRAQWAAIDSRRATENFNATITQARAWANDPNVPIEQRRVCARVVAAVDTARAERKAIADREQRIKQQLEETATLNRQAAELRMKARRARARETLERAGCYSHRTAVDRYLRTGEMRPVERYHDSTLALYASAR